MLAGAPPPGTYNPIEALKRTSPSKAISFGISRDAYLKVFCKGSPTPDLTIPGPGTYPVVRYFGREGRKTTLKARFKNLSNEAIVNS